MTPRLRVLLVVGVMAVFGACSAGPAGPPPLPGATSGGFRLDGVEPLPAVPDLVRGLGLATAWEARYRGTSPCRIAIFEMRADASAFELVQKWRREDGVVPIQAGRYFLAVECPELSTAAVVPLAREVAKAIEAR